MDTGSKVQDRSDFQQTQLPLLQVTAEEAVVVAQVVALLHDLPSSLSNPQLHKPGNCVGHKHHQKVLSI